MIYHLMNAGMTIAVIVPAVYALFNVFRLWNSKILKSLEIEYVILIGYLLLTASSQLFNAYTSLVGIYNHWIIRLYLPLIGGTIIFVFLSWLNLNQIKAISFAVVFTLSCYLFDHFFLNEITTFSYIKNGITIIRDFREAPFLLMLILGGLKVIFCLLILWKHKKNQGINNSINSIKNVFIIGILFYGFSYIIAFSHSIAWYQFNAYILSMFSIGANIFLTIGLYKRFNKYVFFSV